MGWKRAESFRSVSAHSFRSCSGCRIVWPGRDPVGRFIVGSLVAAFFVCNFSPKSRNSPSSCRRYRRGRRRYAPGRNAICRNPTILPRNVRRRSDYASLLARGEGLGYAGSVAPSFLVLDFYVFFLSPCFIEIVCADFRASVHMFYVPVLDFRCFRFFRMKFSPA